MNNRQKYKVSDLIEAIKKNSIPWARGAWFVDDNDRAIYTHKDDTPIASACVLGVGAINLGVEPFDIEIEVEHYDNDLEDAEEHIDCEFESLSNVIITYNDENATSWEDALQFALSQLEPYADIEFIASPRDYTVKGPSVGK